MARSQKRYRHTHTIHKFSEVPDDKKKEDDGNVWGWILGFIIFVGIIGAIGG